MKSAIISSILVFAAFFALTTALLESEKVFLGDLLKLNNLPKSWTQDTLQTACTNWEGLGCNADHVTAL